MSDNNRTSKHQPYQGKLVEVDFDKKFIPRIHSGEITFTIRLKKLGKRMDYFKVETKTYRIHDVESAPLWCFLELFKFEGFSSTEEQLSTLREYYPEITLDTTVFCYCFSEEAVS